VFSKLQCKDKDMSEISLSLYHENERDHMSMRTHTNHMKRHIYSHGVETLDPGDLMPLRSRRDGGYGRGEVSRHLNLRIERCGCMHIHVDVTKRICSPLQLHTSTSSYSPVSLERIASKRAVESFIFD